MRIAILGGGGAMGGLFGGWLCRAGNDVTLIDVSAAAIESINRDGLIIEERDGSVGTFKAPASGDPASVGPVDLIINFVKCYHTEAAVTAARPMIRANTVVLTLQNGWGNADRIAAIVGRERVMVGLTYHSATLLGSGRVKHPGVGITHIGELDGRSTPRLAAVAGALREGGFETVESARILDEVWKKLALNACTLPTAGLLRFFAHELVAYESAKALMSAILREVVDVARSQGVPLEYEERWQAINGLLARAVGGKASMLQDVEASRRTEIEVINGAVCAAGRKAGVATPVNDTLVSLIEALQAKYLAGNA